MPQPNFWQKSDKSKHQPGQPPTGSGQDSDADPEAVAQALATLLTTRNWNETRAMLEREQVLLLTNTAEQMLSGLIQQVQQSDDPDREQRVNYLMLHLALIQRARMWSIPTAWNAFETPHRQAEPDSSGPKEEQRTNLLPRDPDALNNLAISRWNQYKTTGQLEDLNRALECWQEVLKLMPLDSSDRPGYLSSLGLGLRARYERTRALADLEQAIMVFQQAVDILPADFSDRPGYLSNLGGGLYDRYERTGALSDLERAITISQQAVDTLPADSPIRPGLLTNLGLELRARYECIGALTDLERAITIFQQAVDTLPADSPDRPDYLSKLGGGLYAHYGRTGALADLEQTIIVFQQAVDTLPADSSDRPGYLSNLGAVLHVRYERTGALADLEQAITTLQQAVDTTPANSPIHPDLLTNLGLGLLDRYKRTGALADLEQAITTLQQAVNATSANSPGRPDCLSNLATGLRARYERTRALADLEQAITTLQQAADTAPVDSLSNRPQYLSNLGAMLRAHYERTGALADLEQAITALQQAVDTIPADSPGHLDCLSNLGIALRNRYKRTGALADLERALTISQQAVDILPADSPIRPDCLTNLGGGLYDRYEHSGALADLERAITIFQQAVDTLPADSPIRPGHLTHLGAALRARYERTRALADLEQAIAVSEEGWSLLHSRFAMLPVVYQLGQQHQGVNIAADLVSAYLERAIQNPASAQFDCCRAFEIAEGSKSRLLTQLVGRGPLPLPTGLSPTVAAREQQLLAELTDLDAWELATHDRTGPAREEVRFLNHLQRRQELWHELQQVWDGIAKMGPAGADYVALRRGDTLTWNDIVRLAEDLGSATALLSFFTTADQIHLFVFRAGWPAPYVVEAPLDGVGWGDLLQRLAREVHLYDPRRPLRETWESPLRPLLDQVKAHLEGVERLILAPRGIGHLLPWGVLAQHVGWHTQGGQALPLIVLPALGVLPPLWRRPHIPIGPALVVGNPTGDLPFAQEEANTVASLFEAKPLLGAAATKVAVLARLEQASLIHLATHAFFDPQSPLEAGIILADGVLTAREVLEHRLHADLLVLSACDSGLARSLGGEELAGLSQTFFLAGVRSLLVSLWPVNDLATAELMRAFYAARQTKTDKAQALRQAMTQLQQDPRWAHPYYWGAFVLMGDWD